MSEALRPRPEGRERLRQPGQPGQRGRWISLACILAAVLILAGSWVLAPRAPEGQESFGGTDSQARTMLEEAGAQPWFRPVFQPGGGQIESGLFAVQAALGAGVLGYALGRLHGRRRADAADVSVRAAGE